MFLQTRAVILDEDKIYLSSGKFNGLFCIDLKEKKVEYRGRFKEEGYIGDLYLYTLLYKNEICFAPIFGKELAFYNKATGVIRYVKLDEISGGIHDAFIEGDILYLLIQQKSDTIIRYDLNKNELCKSLELPWKVITDKTGYTKQQFEDEEFSNIMADRYNGAWWILLGESGTIIQYGYKRDLLRIYFIEELKDAKVESFSAGERLWIKLCGKSELIEYDYDKKDISRIDFPQIDNTPIAITTIDCGEYIIFTKGKGMALFHKEEKSFYLYSSDKAGVYLKNINYNGRDILFPWDGRDIIVINTKNNMFKRYPLRFDSKLIDERVIFNKSFLMHDDFCDLKEFSEVLKTDQEENVISISTGNSIWKTMKELI